MTGNDKEIEEAILGADSKLWSELGVVMGKQFRDDMGRHMLKSVEERIKEGLREEIIKRGKVENDVK